MPSPAGSPTVRATSPRALTSTGEPARARAVRLLDAAVAARRSDPQVWRLRGRQRVDQGECVAARDDFQRALSLEPDDRASLASLGLALLCLGDEAGAREALGKSAASLGEAHRVLAQGALARGDVARAEREARAAMGERESEAAATLLLAEIDLRRDQPREALRRLDAIRSQVRLPGVKPLANLEFLRGEALARMDRTAEAEAAFREEIRLFPESIPAYQRLALVLALQDRGRDEVRGLLEAMYEASPRRETASLAARTLQTIGDKEGAIAWQKRMVVPGGRR